MSARDFIASENLPELLTAAPSPVSRECFNGVLTGELSAVSEDGGTAWVRFQSQAGAAAVAARTVVRLNETQVGQAVVLMFERMDPLRPIVMGVLFAAADPLADGGGSVVPAAELAARPRTLVLEAQDDIVLRNRNARIKISADGDVEVSCASFTSRSRRLLRLLAPLIKLN